MITFIKQYWRVGLAIALVVILSAHLLADNRVKAQRDEYKAQLTVIEVLAKQQAKEYKLKLDNAKANQAESDKVAIQKISKLKLNKESLTNELRSIYENRKLKPSLGPVARSVLPQPASAESTANIASSEQGLAESEPISGSACAGLQVKNEVLENALALETIYFNQARERIDRDCLQIGCELSTNP